MEDRVVTFPIEAVERVANELQDMDWNMPRAEAEQRAQDIVIDVTDLVDRLRESEREEGS